MKIVSDENFETLFRPVIEALHDLNWLALPDSFRYPSAWLDQGYDAVTDSFVSGPIFEFEHECPIIREGRSYLGHHLKPGMMSRFAAAVSNDWSTLIAMRQSVPDGPSLLQTYFSSPRREEFVRDKAAAFINRVDGHHWQVYIRDAELKKGLHRYLASLKEPVVTEVPWPEAYLL